MILTPQMAAGDWPVHWCSHGLGRYLFFLWLQILFYYVCEYFFFYRSEYLSLSLEDADVVSKVSARTVCSKKTIYKKYAYVFRFTHKYN